jgi:hypothetical protein
MSRLVMEGTLDNYRRKFIISLYIGRMKKRDPSKTRASFNNFKINEEVVELLVVVGSLALRLYLSITE